MHIVHEATIQAAPETIFDLVAAVENWPSLDRAYRWCRILDRSQARIVFEMGGSIRGFPARWMATQERFPAQHRIVFRHIGGLTRGMYVEWALTPGTGGVRVVLTHDLILRWPLIGPLASDLVIGPLFIDWIATRTMEQVKRVAEKGHS